MKKIFLGFLLLVSCNKCPDKVPPFTIQEFTGREESISEKVMVRRPVYRAKVPIGWIRLDPEGSLLDTTQPNVSFLIDENLKVTVHTFPTDTLEQRIPPSAQVKRWQRQLGDIKAIVKTACHGGFVGLFFEGPTVLAWSMQLDLEHYQTLSFLALSCAEEEYFKQMCADYTIKVSGPLKKIKKYRQEIFVFANSFELIQEIPKRM